MEGPPLGPGGEDIIWPDKVAPRGRQASSTRKIKRQTSNLVFVAAEADGSGAFELQGVAFWLVRRAAAMV